MHAIITLKFARKSTVEPGVWSVFPSGLQASFFCRNTQTFRKEQKRGAPFIAFLIRNANDPLAFAADAVIAYIIHPYRRNNQ